MTLLKICSVILFYFIGRAAFAAPCETFTGLREQETLCFNQELKTWISERCVNTKTCDAYKFLKSPKKSVALVADLNGGRNPAAMYCHQLKYEVLILRDKNKNEQSFCVFKDKSMIDVNAVERHLQ